MNHILKSALVKSSIALACISASTSYAQEVEEIVVTAKGNQTIDESLFTTHVFTQLDIEAAQVKDIPALLDRIPGISSSGSGGRGSTTGVFIRGTTSSQIIVLIDGIRVGSATLGSAALNSFPVEAIERIEVIKGPFSGIYGADAAGGVIQLFTKKGGDEIVNISASVGSNSLTEYSAVFNVGDDKNGLTIGAYKEDSNGIDRTSITSGDNDDLDEFEEEAISIAGKVSINDNITASLSILANKSDVEFDNTFGTDTGFKTENEAFNAALNIAAQLTDKIKLVTLFGTNKDESVTAAFGSDLTTQRDTFSTDLSIELNQSTNLSVGIDYYEEEVIAANAFAETERDNKGGFIQLNNRTGNFSFVGNIRYDDNSSYGNETNGSIAIGYDFNEMFKVSANYGTSFSAPSFNALFDTFSGNPNVEPEESESYELNFAGNISNVDWRVSLYKTDFENLIVFVPPTFLATNVANADLEGVELELSTQLYNWNLNLNADILSAEDADTKIELDDRAEETLSFNADRDFGKLNLSFDLKVESNRFDRSGTQLGGYSLFDIAAKYQFNENFSVSANIDNIFDKDFTVNLVNDFERFNTEGRQAKVTVKYSF